MRLIRLSREYIGELIAGKIGTRRTQLDSCALALGSFDGLHRGHAELIKGVIEGQKERGLAEGALFTFLQHPRQVLDRDPGPFLLTTWREKLSLLHETGCSVIVAADFCTELAGLDYREFVTRFLVGYLGMRHLVAGHDVHLGASRLGTAATLDDLGTELGYTMEVLPPVRDGETTISSSAIRRAVAAGDMESAARMLGRPYILWGEVTPGDRRGRRLGFPTANIQTLDPMKLLPKSGVYAVRVQVPGDLLDRGQSRPLAERSEVLPEVDMGGDILSASAGRWAVFGGMLNFGTVPTFHGQGLPEPRVEVNVFDFTGDLRGRNVKVEWVKRLRGEKKFGGADELVAQLHRDGAEARRVLEMEPA